MKRRFLKLSPSNVSIVLLIFLLFASGQAHTADTGIKRVACQVDASETNIEWSASQFHAATVTLKWDASRGPHLAGYIICYSTGSPGPPFNGKGAAEGASPLLIPLEGFYNPDQPQFRIHGLSETETYYFVVRAYSTDGEKSGYSNGVYISPAQSKKSE